VRYAEDNEPIKAGTVYFAPPDRHLLVSEGRLRLGYGPKENHTRPAIDPLFRSAAAAAGPLAIGVVLTGYLTDGTAGLWKLKQAGGTTIVQDPDEAAVTSMPRSALRHVETDHCLKVSEIGRTLNRLATDAARKAPPTISVRGEPVMTYTADRPIAVTCPDCGGAVSVLLKGTCIQFECHIGHTFGVPELANEQFELLGSTLGQSLRLLNERRELCERAAEVARAEGREQEALSWEEAAQGAALRFEELAKFIEADWRRPELGRSLPSRRDEEVFRSCVLPRVGRVCTRG